MNYNLDILLKIPLINDLYQINNDINKVIKDANIDIKMLDIYINLNDLYLKNSLEVLHREKLKNSKKELTNIEILQYCKFIDKFCIEDDLFIELYINKENINYFDELFNNEIIKDKIYDYFDIRSLINSEYFINNLLIEHYNYSEKKYLKCICCVHNINNKNNNNINCSKCVNEFINNYVDKDNIKYFDELFKNNEIKNKLFCALDINILLNNDYFIKNLILEHFNIVNDDYPFIYNFKSYFDFMTIYVSFDDIKYMFNTLLNNTKDIEYHFDLKLYKPLDLIIKIHNDYCVKTKNNELLKYLLSIGFNINNIIINNINLLHNHIL